MIRNYRLKLHVIHECKPGNMPEDYERYEGSFCIANSADFSDWRLRMRVNRTWCGHHPLYWADYVIVPVDESEIPANCKSKLVAGYGRVYYYN